MGLCWIVDEGFWGFASRVWDFAEDRLFVGDKGCGIGVFFLIFGTFSRILLVFMYSLTTGNNYYIFSYLRIFIEFLVGIVR